MPADPARQDRIELRGLRLSGIVGVLPEERDRAQPLEVDLDLLLSLEDASATDSLADTVDYGAVCDIVAELVATLRPELLERLAGEIAAELLDANVQLDEVVVAVRKLRPPVPHQMDSSGVTLRRRRA